MSKLEKSSSEYTPKPSAMPARSGLLGAVDAAAATMRCTDRSDRYTAQLSEQTG